MGPFDEHINMHREVGQVDLMVCALEQSMIIESYIWIFVNMLNKQNII